MNISKYADSKNTIKALCTTWENKLHTNKNKETAEVLNTFLHQCSLKKIKIAFG